MAYKGHSKKMWVCVAGASWTCVGLAGLGLLRSRQECCPNCPWSGILSLSLSTFPQGHGCKASSYELDYFLRCPGNPEGFFQRQE